MPVTVYHYPRCSTCRKALAWLDANDVAHNAVDLVANPPSAEVLARLHKQSGLPLARFFNTSGESYRTGSFRERLPAMTDEKAYAALAADGKLIKRPLLVAGDRVVPGFRADEWAEAVGRPSYHRG